VVAGECGKISLQVQFAGTVAFRRHPRRHGLPPHQCTYERTSRGAVVDRFPTALLNGGAAADGFAAHT
jgi:hypothetical protein